MALYEVVLNYDESKPLDKQKRAWSDDRPGDYEGWTVFPEEYRGRPENDSDAVALIVNGEIIGVQRTLAADTAIREAAEAEAEKALIQQAEAAAAAAVAAVEESKARKAAELERARALVAAADAAGEG